VRDVFGAKLEMFSRMDPPWNSYALDRIFSRELPMEAAPMIELLGVGCYSLNELSLTRLDSWASFSYRT
jgi:hypothetical protein